MEYRSASSAGGFGSISQVLAQTRIGPLRLLLFIIVPFLALTALAFWIRTHRVVILADGRWIETGSFRARITDLQASEDGSLWVAHQGKLSLYRDGAWSEVKELNASSSWQLSLKGGSLWAAADRQVARLHSGTLQETFNLGSAGIDSIAGNADAVWALDRRHQLYSLEGGVWRNKGDSPKVSDRSNGNARELFLASDNTVWACGGALWLREADTWEEITVPVEAFLLMHFVGEADGTIWLMEAAPLYYMKERAKVAAIGLKEKHLRVFNLPQQTARWDFSPPAFLSPEGRLVVYSGDELLVLEGKEWKKWRSVPSLPAHLERLSVLRPLPDGAIAAAAEEYQPFFGWFRTHIMLLLSLLVISMVVVEWWSKSLQKKQNKKNRELMQQKWDTEATAFEGNSVSKLEKVAAVVSILTIIALGLCCMAAINAAGDLTERFIASEAWSVAAFAVLTVLCCTMFFYFLFIFPLRLVHSALAKGNYAAALQRAKLVRFFNIGGQNAPRQQTSCPLHRHHPIGRVPSRARCTP